jgi:hypothetical protein
MARRAITAKRGTRSSNAKGGMVALVGAMILVVVALPLCLVLVAGLAPTIVAAYTDRNPQRYLFRTVGVLNLAGMVVPVATLIHVGLNVAGATLVLFDPYKWLWMYGTSGLGWLIYLFMPSIAKVMVDAKAVKTELHLQERTKALVEEWGEEVTGRKAD